MLSVAKNCLRPESAPLNSGATKSIKRLANILLINVNCPIWSHDWSHDLCILSSLVRLRPAAATGGVLEEKVFLEIPQNKKETLAQVFSCEFCEISKNTFFTEHLWATAFIRQLFHINVFVESKNTLT